MELTELQRDALTELINIAFSRTAASLSELTSNRVDLDAPEVHIESILNLEPALKRFVHGDVATVHQIFFGALDGDALLVLNHDGAVKLVELLTGPDGSTKRLSASGKEVLGEVGNILLNACLGVFGNLLQIRLGFTVPRLDIEELGTFLRSIVIGKDELQHALIVGARFRVRVTEVTGCLVLVLGISSMKLLSEAIDTWAVTAMSGAPPPLTSEPQRRPEGLGPCH
jgi:chemotaxis protein CheC